MWFIELPAGTSLWEYTSVRQQPAVLDMYRQDLSVRKHCRNGLQVYI